ncbi:RluA family pseudouridine synthase [Myxococcus sp. K38C18041901]|uniref:pseudouridine synthase n=1 Tax=Myxococcus guangdongensis TaxID=2906760 RepID=UPI0020A7E4BE|nr:pseudouridine synthase [Myxococcus guangdongensis]MCP3059054.1 RluA family pseudouridine synthase [Myxococcus guangdongensis]
MSEPPLSPRFFDAPPSPREVPSRLPSPFAPGPPGALARRAAGLLRQRLEAEAPRWESLWRPGGGKMFGVLVVSTGDGPLGFLSAFSGMLGGSWEVEGFAPPLFDPRARETFLPEGEAELAELGHRLRELSLDHERAVMASGASGAEARALDERRDALAHARAERSRALWHRLTWDYDIPNARGNRVPLASLFDPRPVPGGAGECAAPKLLAQAYRQGLKPLALAEFWWGAEPEGGGRVSGAYYPACDSKCRAVLGYMLEGLDVDPAPPPASVGEVRVVYEDAELLVVDKDAGLLSVPGRHAPSRDSVLVRLQSRFPELTSAHFIHALDAEVSGLQLMARDTGTRAALQRQLARGEAEHRHVAWVEGRLPGPEGRIDLPLRGTTSGALESLASRAHGKHAVTDWRVVEAQEGRTRVWLWPRTRHAWQLRIHTAHPEGLGAPILGDTRFGSEAGPWRLHAEGLVFTHPHTGARHDLRVPAPF